MNDLLIQSHNNCSTHKICRSSINRIEPYQFYRLTALTVKSFEIVRANFHGLQVFFTGLWARSIMDLLSEKIV